ncbi:hypothetical protein GUJ93_ZPchr0006g44112 [Zizania palustris]|uniref:Uncharacterized protein n=1 Tax=Zizania palustris TaxID=103762 RepID=A0A8J5SSC2_ZIZPA|nr:hypothetical protein GUJ93_ZPchr0006g44112 [Zizania palustris]
MGLWDALLNWLRSLFFKQEMELSLVGLQNAGKTSLVNAVATGGYSEDMIPTVGFNMRKVTKGNVTIKLWDLGGQRRFRTMWERYCRGVSAILYVVDAADRDSIPIAKSELHDLLTKQSLADIPLLVLGNKIDKSEAVSKPALVDQLGLEFIKDREVCCYMISCKDTVNIDVVIDWLIKHSKTANFMARKLKGSYQPQPHAVAGRRPSAREENSGKVHQRSPDWSEEEYPLVRARSSDDFRALKCKMLG